MTTEFNLNDVPKHWNVNPNHHAKMLLAAQSPEASRKRIKTFKKIKHAQGSKNSQWKSRWITDGTISKKIGAKDPIPKGWKLGRNSRFRFPNKKPNEQPNTQ